MLMHFLFFVADVIVYLNIIWQAAVDHFVPGKGE